MQKDGRHTLSQNFYIPQEVVETKLHTTFERESLRSDGENPVFKLLERDSTGGAEKDRYHHVGQRINTRGSVERDWWSCIISLNGPSRFNGHQFQTGDVENATGIDVCMYRTIMM